MKSKYNYESDLFPHPSKTFTFNLYETKNFYIKIKSHKVLFLLSFERPKERSKEKSPAGEKLPKIISQWRAKISTSTELKDSEVYRYMEIFATPLLIIF